MKSACQISNYDKEGNYFLNSTSTSVTTNHAQSHSLQSFVVEKATRKLLLMFIYFENFISFFSSIIYKSHLMKHYSKIKAYFFIVRIGSEKRENLFSSCISCNYKSKWKRNPSDESRLCIWYYINASRMAGSDALCDAMNLIIII
jgi:hypothetical protein